MRKHNKILKFFFLIGILFHFSCEKEEIYEPKSENSKNLVVKHYKLSELKSKSIVYEKINNLAKTKPKSNYLRRTVNVNDYGFSVETEDIMYIQDGDNYSYTFKIYRDTLTSLTENLVLKPKEDGSFETYLVQYNYSEEDKQNYNNGLPIVNKHQKTQIQLLDNIDTNAFFRGGGDLPPLPTGCCWELIDYEATINYDAGTWEVIDYYQINCYCSGGSGSGTGDSGNTGGWSGSGNTDSGSNPSSGDTGGTSGGNSTGSSSSSSDPLITAPVGLDGIGIKKECAKIFTVLKDSILKQKIVDLLNNVNTATEEKAVALHADGTKSEYIGSGGIVQIPPNPTSKYVAMAHNHDINGNAGNGTYSIFSSGDLGLIALSDVVYNKIDMDKFVSFLVTSKGTRYAFTISNKTKFRNFYEFVKWKRDDITPNERYQFLLMAEKKQKILDKYFDYDKPHANYPFIKETNTNNDMDLLFFVNFLSEADIGVSIFEVDASLENFTEVKKDPNNPTTPTKSGCN